MKILHIIDSLTVGGAEKLMLDTLPIFNSMEGITADVALLDAKEYIFLKKLEEKKCCKIYKLSEGTVYNPLLIFKLIPLIKKYDIIHVHLFPAQYFSILANIFLFNKKKIIFTEHNNFNRRMENPLFKWLERIVYYFYDKIICITPQVKNALKDNLSLKEEKLTVIQNGIDIKTIKEAPKAIRETFNFHYRDVIIIMVAKFRLQKDHETILDSLALLPENYKLLLVGDGERQTLIQEKAKNLNVTNRVVFAGARNDVFLLFKMSDIAVLSSHWEGFGLSAAEAMASGTPLLASNVPGLAEVVGNGGILFEKGNANDLTEKIKCIISDKNLYNDISNKGITQAEKYDIHFMVTETLRLYKTLI